MAKLAGPTIVILLALTIACSQGTETAPDVGATVDAAVAATVEAQNAVPPSTPAQMIDATLAAILASDAATFEAQSPVPPSTPTQTIDATLAAAFASDAATFEAQSPVPPSTPTQTIDATLAAALASAAATFEAQSAVPASAPTQTSVGQAIPAPIPTTVAVPTHTLTPTPTPLPMATPTPTPIPFDIKKANCQHGDIPFDDYELASSEGPYSWPPHGVREWYSTNWSSDGGSKIQCLTSIYNSIEDARWALQYSTAVQNRWGQEKRWSGKELLEHRQVVVPAIGEDTLAIEIEVGRKIRVQGEEVPSEEYVATIVTFRWANVVATVEYGWETGSNPLTARYSVDAFFNSSPDRAVEIAHLFNERIRAELERVDH